ncbi:hypothetical protein LZF95_08320 [Algoriphagus sp. AGSA1]|uniref:hypothetical protein n=1 Tax=Algoriphagus sp. AGSA1 TaxID=2907213 RepID=UPI001F18575D|nr:hypothetical protein [Algoriphagus sp. AGSA1]MCE7054674.1 hypothetical protein [Algoriphagus sp. AGSA1]
MNKQESKLYYRLSEAQGIYYIGIGVVIMLYSLTSNQSDEYLILQCNSALVGSLIVGIGCALFIGKKYPNVPSPICIIGLASAGSIFITQVNDALAGQSAVIQSLDLAIELTFIGLWIYLIYWKWINRKFSKLNTDD